MAGQYSSSPNARGKTIRAVFILFFLTILAALNLNILGQSVALSLLPLIGICLWPRYAHPVISIIVIFLFGLLLDFLTNDALGFRTLIYLIIFSVFRPDTRSKQHTFGTAFVQWLGIIILALVAVYFLGWVGRSVRPDLLSLGYQALLTTTLFPVIYFIRHIFRYFLIDPDDRY